MNKYIDGGLILGAFLQVEAIEGQISSQWFSNGLQHKDVCRHILEYRFTHFVLYVVTRCNLPKDLYLGTKGVYFNAQFLKDINI